MSMQDQRKRAKDKGFVLGSAIPLLSSELCAL